MENLKKYNNLYLLLIKSFDDFALDYRTKTDRNKNIPVMCIITKYLYNKNVQIREFRIFIVRGRPLIIYYDYFFIGQKYVKIKQKKSRI